MAYDLSGLYDKGLASTGMNAEKQKYAKYGAATIDPRLAGNMAFNKGKDWWNNVGVEKPQQGDSNEAFAAMDRYRPEFNSPLTAGGQFRPGFEIEPTQMKSSVGELNERLGQINLDKRGLEAYRERALAAPGTSAWEQMQLARQGTEEAKARDLATAQQGQGLAQARAQLSMRGGLSGGAAERLAAGGAKQRMLSGQDVARSGMQARQGIGLEAETQRLGALQNLPGMEVQALQPELQKTSMWGNMASSENQFNAQQKAAAEMQNKQMKLQAMDAQNKYGQNIYGEQMKAWAGGKQAQAIENAGKK